MEIERITRRNNHRNTVTSENDLDHRQAISFYFGKHHSIFPDTRLKSASGALSWLLGFLAAPIVFDIVLRYVYKTDIFVVLAEGQAGWQKYVIADVVAFFVVIFFVTLSMAGARHAYGMVRGK